MEVDLHNKLTQIENNQMVMLARQEIILEKVAPNEWEKLKAEAKKQNETLYPLK